MQKEDFSWKKRRTSLPVISPQMSSASWDSTLSTKILNLSAEKYFLDRWGFQIFKHKSSYVILEVQLWAILRWQDDHILNADKVSPEALLKAVCGVWEPKQYSGEELKV